MVEHTKSPVIQTDDYYPFGSKFNRYSRENSMLNKYLYNKGSEHQDALDLDAYQTRYRFLDSWIGRWWQVDPKPSDAISVYASMDNNPVGYNDPDGDCIPCALQVLKAIGNLMKGADAGTKQRYQTEPKRGATVTGIRDTKAGRINATTGKPVGDTVIRIDKPHGNVKTPHININPAISGVPDPHTAISSKTLTALEGTGRALDAISKVAKPAAIVTDVVRVGSAVAADGGTVGENTIKTSASVAGGWGGAIAGAAIGAEGGAYVGGAIGVWFGGVGAAPGVAIGGLIGGLGGGIAGSFGGSWLGESSRNCN